MKFVSAFLVARETSMFVFIQFSVSFGVDIGNPVVVVTPSLLSSHYASAGSKDVIQCQRIQVSGVSRLKLKSYASCFRVTLAPSEAIPERLHGKIKVCFHRNETLGLCQCIDAKWKSVKGTWNSVMSPYEVKYIDVKFTGKLSRFVRVAIQEDFQQWRLLSLALGFALLFVAPLVSNWVPFYYSSSIVMGVFLFIMILLFQGTKILLIGRKGAFYFALYGSVLGLGSFLLNHFSMLVNSMLVRFGVSEEMQNPVCIFLLVGIILGGAAWGCWVVRKFVLTEDGRVDLGVAQYVKWAMRIIGATFILQSTLDPLLGLVTLVSCWGICKLIFCLGRRLCTMNATTFWRKPERQTLGRRGRVEFLSREKRA